MPKHELITGPVGSGKSYAARQRIDEDIKTANTQAWVIDYYGAEHLGVIDDVTRYAAGPDGAKSMLFEVLGHAYLRAERLAGLDIYEFNKDDQRHGYDLIALTIDSAEALLRSADCTRAMVRILQMARKTGVKVRMVAPDLHMLGNGVIVHTMNGAIRTECDYSPETATA
ncbi:hypothetical protein AB0C69_28530 [Actinomadura sp. NPDC048032]|uniref:hypothetical protein n=1 Tax=Actinomadura sp. NPDC048032 TaxID=3155747 RepID=UPI0033D3E743